LIAALPARRVLVTRPLDQAREWVSQLQARGIEAVALPMLGIEPMPDPAPLKAAWAAMARHGLLMFVSPNAVQHFFAQRPAGAVWPDGLLAASPGPGTSAALRAAGVADALLVEPPVAEGRFDSEALWAVLRGVRPWRGACVLVLRGSVDDTPQGSGRDWLAQQLREAGAEVDMLAVYRRAGPHLDAAQREVFRQALAEPARQLWLFSSSEAVDQARAAADAEGASWRPAAALATHPRIAERARAAGFAPVTETAPTLDAVAAAAFTAAGACGTDR
jgi:uroporphyrinogen-III synthase